MPFRFRRYFVALLGSAALVAASVGVSAGPAAALSRTLFVGCGFNTYPTIGAAVLAAPSGATIVVCPGTYHESVVVPSTEKLTIRGIAQPVIDAGGTGPNPGVQVLSSGTVIKGFTVENAFGEGILVGSDPGAGPTISGVSIENNTIINDDQGNPTNLPLVSSAYGQCAETPQTAPAPPIPGDCGEGIHLLSANNSTVVNNRVYGDSGGILLTDENGPTFGNLIAHNVVAHNQYDCGVTVAGHNIALAGGIYHNTIADNLITNNGVLGQGAGVLFASPVPGGVYGTGGAVYDNLVEGNYIWGNGLGGVTVHSHSTGQDLSGNSIVGNFFGTNNLAPDPDFAFAGKDFIDGQTTGIVIATLSDITINIADNVVANDANGIWIGEVFGAKVTVTGTASNVFVNEATPVVVVTH
jgi:parallel beta-helix repeat protein